MKFKLLPAEEEIVNKFGLNTCYRIQATKDIYCRGTLIRNGDLGGYVEVGENLSQKGGCWICDRSIVLGNSRVSGDSFIIYGENDITGGWSIIKDSKISGINFISGSEVRSSIIRGGELIGCFVNDSFLDMDSFCNERIIGLIACQKNSIYKFPVPPPNDIELLLRAVQELPENKKAEFYRRLIDEI